MATLLVGYDVEAAAVGEGIARLKDPWFDSSLEPESTVLALDIMAENHAAFDAPATIFVCGRTLLHSLPAFREIVDSPLFNIEQHTYSHVLFKDNAWRDSVFRASPAEAIRHELSATSGLLREHLGIDSIGLRTPHGYYQGLTDRPEYLTILRENGIKFVSSWGRSAEGTNPTPWVQPFWYAEQGFPEILEIPFQGWLDAIWFEAHGRDQGREYGQVLARAVDEIAEQDLVYGACFHDWAQLAYRERETGWIRTLLSHARDRGVEILSYRDYYEKAKAKLEPASVA